MDIRCPSCKTLYEFNEARLKRGPVNLKCSQCGHVFRVEGRKGDKASTANRWMLRKTSGDVLYFQGLSTLQKWIVDRKVDRKDEISKTGKKWKTLGTIGELSSFFQVADNIESLERVKEPEVVPVAVPPSGDLADASPSGPSPTPLPEPPETDYFDPLAPGSPADDSSDAPASDDWAMNQGAPSSDDWIIDRSSQADSDDAGVAISLDMSAELAPPKPLEPRRTPSGTYDDPLEDKRKDEGSLAPLLIVLILLLVLFLVAFAYLYRPHWLGLAPAPGEGPYRPVATKSVTDAGSADKSAADTGVASAEDASADQADAEAIAATPDAGKGEDKNADKGADKGTDKGDDKKQGEDKAAEKGDDKKGDDKKANKGNAKKTKEGGGGGFDGAMRRAKQHLNAGRPAEALREYGRAADARPNNLAALTGKARAYLAMGRPDAAINIYNQVLRMSPGNGMALMGIADAYRRSGQTQKAIDAYKKYLARQSSGPTADRARRNIERLGGTAPPAP